MRHRRYRVAPLWAIVLQMLTATYSQAADFEDRLEKRFPAGPGSVLTIANTVGEVEIEAWAQDSIHVVVEKKVKKVDEDEADGALQAIGVEIESGPEAIDIR